MTTPSAHQRGRETLLSLLDCVSQLLQSRSFVSDQVPEYLECLDCSLADLVELISGTATDVGVEVPDQDHDDDTLFLIENEPTTLADALHHLPGVNAKAIELVRSRVDVGPQTCCMLACRYATFAFFLRERDEQSLD